MNPDPQASASLDDPPSAGPAPALSVAGRQQILPMLLLTAISALDGFNVLSVTFAAPGFSREFGIDKTALGWTFSTGLVGMGLGSLLLAPLADVFGRRRLVLGNLLLMMAGMFAGAAANSWMALTSARFATGLGVGAMIAVLAPLASEYASTQRRELMVGLMSVGYPIGGLLGGALSTLLLREHGWRAVFVLGGVAAAALIPLVLLRMPESIAYLLDRRPGNAVQRINRVLRSRGAPTITALPRRGDRPAATPLRELLGHRVLWQTLQITAINFLFVTTAYYFLSWMPSIVAAAGYAPAQAAAVSVLANLTGIGGGLLLGWLAPRFGLRRVTSIALIGTGTGTALFGASDAGLATMRVVAAVTGFFLFAGFVGILSLVAGSFAPRVRATGSGLVIGVGRAGSALATVAAGALFAVGLGSPSVSLLMGSCALIAGVCLAGLRVKQQQ